MMPGARTRSLLAAFAEQLPRVPDRHYIWLPKGPWEPEETAALAEEFGLVGGFDPVQQERPPGTIVYGMLTTMGAQTTFSEASLSDVFERINEAPYTEAFITIDSMRSFQQAVRLQQVSQGELER